MADAHERDEHDGGGSFMMGLLTGTVLGAGLGILLAPKSGRELRHDIGEGASTLGRAATEQFKRASDAAGGAMSRTRDAAGHGIADSREALEGSGSAGAPAVTRPATGDRPVPAGGSTYTGSTERS